MAALRRLQLCGRLWKGRATIAPLFLLWLLLAPACAHANMILPSLVHMILAPGPCTLMLLPAVVTLPLLLAVAVIEALVAYRVTRVRSLGWWFVLLFVANFFSTFLGMGYADIAPSELWRALGGMLLVSILVEALFCVAATLRAGQGVWPGAAASVLMNVASYAAVALLLVYLTVSPQRAFRDDLDIRSLPGQIVVENPDESKARRVYPTVGDLDPSSVSRRWEAAVSPFTVGHVDGKRCVVDAATGRVKGRIPVGPPYKGPWVVSPDGAYAATTVNAKASLGFSAFDVVLCNVGTGTYRRMPAQGDFAFSPVGSQFLIEMAGVGYVFDLPSRQQHLVPMPGASGEFDWSPDGRYLAYVADTAPAYRPIGDSPRFAAVRVVRVSDGRQKTILQAEKLTGLGYVYVFWFP